MKKELKVSNPILNPAMSFIGQETIEKVDGIVDQTEESVIKKTDTPVIEETKRGPGRPKVNTKKKQYTVTLKPELYEEAVQKAEKMGISFSALVTNALNEYLNK